MLIASPTPRHRRAVCARRFGALAPTCERRHVAETTHDTVRRAVPSAWHESHCGHQQTIITPSLFTPSLFTPSLWTPALRSGRCAVCFHVGFRLGTHGAWCMGLQLDYGLRCAVSAEPDGDAACALPGRAPYRYRAPPPSAARHASQTKFKCTHRAYLFKSCRVWFRRDTAY